MRSQTVIIPVYQPTSAMPTLVRALSREFARIIVVDDGSTEGTKAFDDLGDLPSVNLLRHTANRGKGAALKTAFSALLADARGASHAVTVDADGQHLVRDILKVSEAAEMSAGRMVLGARRFSGRVPFRSRLGNLWTIGEFRLLTGRTVHDTQSGLRAIPVELLPRLMDVRGERYEYEIGVLAMMAREGLVIEVPVETVYLDGNRTSHFRPLADTLSTQLALFRAALAGGGCRSGGDASAALD